MSPRTPSRPTVASAFVLSLAIVAGCGGSESGTEAFCSELAALEEIDLDAVSPDPFVDALRRVDDAAPSEVSGATAALREFIELSAEISTLDPDGQAAALGDLEALLPGFETAAEDLEDYARDNCPDLTESFFGS